MNKFYEICENIIAIIIVLITMLFIVSVIALPIIFVIIGIRWLLE